MSSDDRDGEPTYIVVVNDEEQYSLWPSHRSVPGGWRSTGMQGSKADCIDYVDRTWTDITPLSVRRRLTPG